MRARGNGTNGRSGRTDHGQVNAWRRYEVMKIAALRFNTRQLPNTAEGRRFLAVLVGLRLPHLDIYKIAPWCEAQLRDLADQVAADRRPLHADRIGNAIEFAFDELKELAEQRHYSVTQVAPYDAQRHEVQAYWEKRRRDADRDRKQRMRATRPPKKEAHMKPRTKLVRNALTDEWIGAREIENRVAPLLKLDKATLNVAVGRELKLLVKHGEAERKIEPGPNGRPTLFVRRATPRVHGSGQETVVHNAL